MFYSVLYVGYSSCAQVWEALSWWDVHPGSTIPVLHVSVMWCSPVVSAFLYLCLGILNCNGFLSKLKMLTKIHQAVLKDHWFVFILKWIETKTKSSSVYPAFTLPFLPQDKELHPRAAPAPSPTRVQAQRRDEGISGGRPFAADPDRAPPLSAGPQVTEGPPSGPALHPEAG